MALLNNDFQLIIRVLEDKRTYEGKVDSIRLGIDSVKYIAQLAKDQKHAFTKEDTVEKAKNFFRLVRDRKEQ